MKNQTKEQAQLHHDRLWEFLKPLGFSETGNLCKFAYPYQGLYFDFSTHSDSPHILFSTISDKLVYKGRQDQKEETQEALSNILGLNKN